MTTPDLATRIIQAVSNIAPEERASALLLDATLARVREMATGWTTQATDYDDDTEQQILDGKEILAALDGDDDA